MTRPPLPRTVIHVLLALAMVGCRSAPTPTTAPKPVSFPAENDVAFDALDGGTARLSDYAGKVIVLNFWAIWCAPCRMEMPELEAIYQQYRDQGVVVLAVNVSEGASDIAAYIRSNGLTFPIVRDSKLTAARSFRVSSLPTTLFFDRQGQLYRWSEGDGRVLDRAVGARDGDFFAKHITALLD